MILKNGMEQVFSSFYSTSVHNFRGYKLADYCLRNRGRCFHRKAGREKKAILVLSSGVPTAAKNLLERPLKEMAKV